MNNPRIAARQPMSVDVEAGRSYAWCACGRSGNQPFCDGSHQGTGFSPVQYRPEESGTVVFCCCKHTGNQPFCDGSHTRLDQ